MRPWSIRLRLTALNGAVVAAILVGLGLAVYGLMRHALFEQADAGLAFEFAEAAEQVRARGEALAANPRALPEAFRAAYRLRLTGPDGRIRLQSPALAGHPLPPAPPDGGTHLETVPLGPSGPHRLIAGAVAGPGGRWALRIAAPLGPVDRELAELRAALLTLVPAGLLAAVVGGYALAGRALAPVHRMTEAARRVSAANLHERIAADHPADELGRLAATLNAMLDRIDRAFTAMRQFTADAAHELRTPLTAIRTEVEVALQAARTPERLAAVLASVLEEVDRLTRLTDRLLVLSREDAGIGAGDLRPTRLDEAVCAACELARAPAERAGIDLRLTDLPAATVRADPDRLCQVFGNLLDNAVKYNRPGGSVVVRGHRADGWAIVEVADTGIGIPAEARARIFDRFYRVDPARSRRTGGAGLGLSIARALVGALRGRIEVESTPGRGSTFRVALPLVGHEPRE